MPYKIQVQNGEGWEEVDSALTLLGACEIASRIYKRVRYLTQNEIRIVLDGEVIV